MKIIGISPHRRNFLRKAVTAAPTVALLAGAGIGIAASTSSAAEYRPIYFSSIEWRSLMALVDRMIPVSPDGPGALDAGVHEFIDAQMDTPYAHGGLWYMQAPFTPSAAPEFGYQFHMAPRELYRSALAGIDLAARTQFGKPLADIAPAQIDTIIGALEQGTVSIGEVPPKTFFAQLLANTREGYFCDPVHGGNKGMAAWRMIGFPGARGDYMDWVEQYGKKYPLPPSSLA